jgi:triosephosphate isomerase
MPSDVPRALVAGNWKMNGTTATLAEVRLLVEMLTGVTLGCDVLICPPATLLATIKERLGSSPLRLGGQDCHARASGAHTGDVSAEMIKDAGASAVIVGHSERRAEHCETDEQVRAKAGAAHRAGLAAILCIGETLEQRKGGETFAVLTRQLEGSLPKGADPANTIIAYEPVWAIGSGLTPSPPEVAEAHGHIRKELTRLGVARAEEMRILYGGSVKPDNAPELLKARDVNGALVGGASLKAADFIGILKVYG